MTRKDFQLLAKVMLDAKPRNPHDPGYGMWKGVLGTLANELKTTNPRFNVVKFIDAASNGILEPAISSKRFDRID